MSKGSTSYAVSVNEIIPYRKIEEIEGFRPERGMNYKIKDKNYSIVLMSVAKGAPYKDKISEDGKEIIYEGHNLNKRYCKNKNPNTFDQPVSLPNGKLTENGKFMKASHFFKDGLKEAEKIRVYQKIKPGMWTFNGVFNLVDGWEEKSGERTVFKFKLLLTDEKVEGYQTVIDDIVQDNRIIPGEVQIEVFNRDKGKCVKCGSTDHLHYDHIIPFSKGGTSKDAKNIRLYCRRHNLEKSDKIGK